MGVMKKQREAMNWDLLIAHAQCAEPGHMIDMDYDPADEDDVLRKKLNRNARRAKKNLRSVSQYLYHAFVPLFNKLKFSALQKWPKKFKNWEFCNV